MVISSVLEDLVTIIPKSYNPNSLSSIFLTIIHSPMQNISRSTFHKMNEDMASDSFKMWLSLLFIKDKLKPNWLVLHGQQKG